MPASRLQRLLFRLLPIGDREEMQADMLELFADRRTRGPAAAHVWLWMHTLVLAVRLRWERPTFTSFGSDFRIAGRSMRRAPAVTATIVATLALGIGATTGVFSLVASAFFARLPMAAPERLVLVGETISGRAVSVSYPNFLDWQVRSRAFDSIALYQSDTATLRRDGQASRIKTYRVTESFIPTLGVSPAIGRAFVAADHQAGAARVALLSHRAWMSTFGGNASVLNTTVLIDEEPCTIVGVMRPGFEFYRDADAWLPLEPFVPGSELLERRTRPGTAAIARLGDGRSQAAALQDLKAVAQQLSTEFPDANTNVDVTLTDLRTALVGPAGAQLWMLFGAVAGLLLIGVLNAASLMGARVAARRSEFALRTTLGAGPGRLARQLIAEGLVIAGAAGLIGVAIAAALISAAQQLDPGGIPGLPHASLDVRVLGFCLALSLVTGLAFGLVPLFQTGTLSIARRLADSGRSSRGLAAPRRLGTWMVTAQVSLTLMLVAGSALMLQTIVTLFSTDVGFRTHDITHVNIQLNTPGTPDEGRQRVRDFYRQLIERIATLPGVTGAAVANPLPLSGANRQSRFLIEGQAYRGAQDLVRLDVASVSAGYFGVMAIPTLRGETFGPQHAAGAISAVVVDDLFAEQWFPNQDPVGRWIQLGGPASPNPRIRIIGVVGRVHQSGPGVAPKPQLYVSQGQWPLGGDFIVGTATGTSLSSADLRQVVTAIEPSAVVWSVQPYAALAKAAVASPQFSTVVVSLFAVIALALAGLGVYGMVAYDVAQRRPELGVRMALGATGADVARTIVRRAMIPVAIGGVAGLAGSIAAGQFLGAAVAGSTPSDPRAYLIAVAIVVAAGLAGTIAPSVRAARVDPITTLRSS